VNWSTHARAVFCAIGQRRNNKVWHKTWVLRLAVPGFEKDHLACKN